MIIELEKLLLSELRIVVYEPAPGPNAVSAASEQQALSDDKVVMAMTVNEELRNLGYTLKPEDIFRLARSRS